MGTKRARMTPSLPSGSSNGHPQSAVGSPKAPAGQGSKLEKGYGSFRFWTDARRFKGSEDKCIVQQALYEAGGVRTGGYPKASPIAGPLGYARPSDWDFLWSPARLALKALPAKPGQLVSALPGMMSLTRKRKLSVTLKEAYGEAAFAIMPRTFSLPDELGAWRAHIEAAASHVPLATGGSEQRPRVALGMPAPSFPAGSDVGDMQEPQQQLWMLKTAQHLGKGLRLLPADRGIAEASNEKLKSRGEKPYVQAQQYIGDPLLINGKKSGIRVWVMVTGYNPLRAYVHELGLVLFSNQGYDAAAGALNDAGDVAVGHVTNYAQNMHGGVWSLTQLREHLGPESYDTLWRRICASCASTVAAALPKVREAHTSSGVAPGSTFELMGLDFLVDAALHPWLLEVNGTPSLAVDHADPVVEALIHEQKAGMVRDMAALLGLEQRFAPRYAAMRLAARSAATTAAATLPKVDNNGPGADGNTWADAREKNGTDAGACSDESDQEHEHGAVGAAEGSSMGAEAGVSPGGASNGNGAAAALTDDSSAAEYGLENNAAGAATGDAGSSDAAAASGGSSADGGRVAAAARLSHARALRLKRLQEQMAPRGDAEVWEAVQRELSAAGGFQPLMPMFPIGRGSTGSRMLGQPDGGSAGIAWDARDLQMPALLRQARRQKARTATLASACAPSTSDMQTVP